MKDLRSSALAAGYVPLDIVCYRGRTWHAAGGTAGNVVALLGFLGWNAALLADVGNDLAGRRLRRDLKKSNVSVEYVRVREGMATPRLVHEIVDSAHRYLFRCPKCRTSLPTSRPLRSDRAAELITLCSTPDVFFLDRLNAGTVMLAEHFAAHGSVVVFEPSRPARPELTRRVVAIADVIKHADDREAGLSDSDAVPKKQVRIVTRGAGGASYRVGTGAWHHSPAFSYPVVDAGGAGDWTTAGLIHALPREGRWSVQAVGDALRWGQALAAISCGSPGARGLARQQNAEAVLRAARFLEQRAEPDLEGEPQAWSDVSSPRGVCGVCLQGAAESLGAGGAAATA